MDFNNFNISGNENEYRLQVSYLLVYFTCNVNMTSIRRHLLHVWRGLQLLLIDDTVNQWPTRLCACVNILRVHYKSMKCDVMFLFHKVA